MKSFTLNLWPWKQLQSRQLLNQNQMTNFNHVQTESICRWQFLMQLKSWKFSLLSKKTLWEREKMLITSIFSFSQDVFKRLLLLCRKKEALCIKLLTHYHTMPHFDALKIYSCGKHYEKRRNCLYVTSNFSFSHNVFYPIWHFIFILNAL